MKPNGMILSTGPTGCGKTTALYAILKTLNKSDVSIITIEEPIEYAIPGIRQIQVNAGSNLNFESGLRSILRQDPNIIMVGEIRDRETAVIAVNAALTGHLLLSTLHTNDAAATLPRLIQMGIEPFLLASTFSIAINQRLVKKLCDKCKREEKINVEQKNYLKDLFKKDVSRQKFWRISSLTALFAPRSVLFIQFGRNTRDYLELLSKYLSLSDSFIRTANSEI